MDISGAVANWVLSAGAILTAAVSYGKSRQETADLREKVNAMDARITALGDLGRKIDLQSQAIENSAERGAEQREADRALMGEKMEGLRGEVRSFMQGQASMGSRRPPRPKPQ